LALSKNLRALNLNNLPILREILRQESVSKAAEALNLSQPAVSNVLKSLRDHFGDELLARDGAALRLTAKGKQLLDSLEAALSQVETAIEGQDFDPATAEGPVRIATADNLIGALAGPLCEILAKEAPHLQVQFLSATRRSALELRAGAIDLAIASTVLMGSGLADETTRSEMRVQPLADEQMVCIGRSDDAELAAGITLNAYLERRHVSYILDAEQHHTLERQQLSELGLRQKTRLATSSYQCLPGIVVQGRCLALVPVTLAQVAATHHPIQIVKSPLPMPDISWVMVWHERNSDSPLVQWTKSALLRCANVFDVDFETINSAAALVAGALG
jgi:LysR family transcriptional regulator, nod-box dependent transcriptional activator